MAEDPPEPGFIQAPPGYAFPKSADKLLPWSRTEERLEAARYYWLATTRPDGRPYVTPLWGVWVDRALFLDGPAITRWGRNLTANPHASINLESGGDVVIVEGIVDDLVTDAELGDRIADAWTMKYARLVPKPASDGIWRFRPTIARAWSTEMLTDGTRWRFGGN